MSDILDSPTLSCAICGVPTTFGAMRHLNGEMVCRYCYEKPHEELPAGASAELKRLREVEERSHDVPDLICAICGWDHDASVCPERPGGEMERVAKEEGSCYGCDSKVPVDVLFEYQGQKFCPLCCDTLQSVVLRTGKEPAL